MCQMGFLGEIVGPFYQIYEWLKHRNMHEGTAAKWVLLSAMFTTYLIRMPMALGAATIAVRDILIKLWPDTAMWIGPRLAPVDTYSGIDEVQPLILVPSIGGCLMIAVLDTIWMRKWAHPRLQAIMSQGRRAL